MSATSPTNVQLRNLAFGSPTGFLALGFGSGLSPKAPGTAGTVMACLLWYPVSLLPWISQLLVVFVSVFMGVWLCQKAADALGVHDHPAIVWDEFVGMWAVLLVLAPSLSGWFLGFCLFRLFDVLKPWPIRWFDQNLEGGLGIMVDDLLAALFTCLVLFLINFWWSVGLQMG